MKLSENQNYINYMNQRVNLRFAAAVEALTKCLEDFRGDNLTQSFLLKLIADAYFHDGKIEKTFEYYSMSEKADAESLQPKLFFAEFLANKLKNYDKAVNKCDEILRLAKENPLDETHEDFSSVSRYISKAEELRSFCQQQIAAQNGGTK